MSKAGFSTNGVPPPITNPAEVRQKARNLTQSKLEQSNIINTANFYAAA